MRKLTYGRTSAADRGTITNHEAPWEEIAELFRQPTRRQITTTQYLAMDPKGRAKSKNTGLFFGGRCRDGHRSDSTLHSRSIVNLDIDEHAEALWGEFALLGTLSGLDGFTYLVHTTRSHSEEVPKLRVLVPLARDVTPAEYEPVARALAERLDPSMKAVARESYPPAQGMYFPSVSCDQEYHFASLSGEFFDPDRALTKYPANDASRWPRAVKEAVTEYRPGRKMTHPEDKATQAPIITAVHRAFDPWTFIERFLGDVYHPSGDRYYPEGASGAPSVRIYDDAFIQSDHGSDPAVGQHNTFDLGRIHLFRHLDDEFDTTSMSPVEWPSYKAMVEFMLQQPEVRDALETVRDEVQSKQAQAALDLLDDLDDEDDDDEPPAAEDGEDEDDLIGAPVEKAAPSIEDVLRKVKRAIAKAESLNDLDRRLEKIRAIPTTTLKDFHRDMLVSDVQRKMHELTGEKPAKPVAKKMLAPTIENLRDQMVGQPVPEWLEDWVFVTGENIIFNVVTKEVLTKDPFNGRFNRATGDQFGSSEMGLAKITAYDAATQVFQVPMPYKLRYSPAEPALFEEDGLLYANTYRAPVIGTSAYKGRKGVIYLLRLIEELLPDPYHQALVLDFMAHCIRFPGKKLRYALLIKGSEEEGKSLLGSVVGRLVGKSNYSIIGTDQLLEKYNSWSHGRCFAVVEEIKLPGKEAHEVLNKMKPVISNEEVPIRRMHHDATTESNYCNLYLTTNFEDCLPLEDDNTRFCVLFTRFRTNGQVAQWREKRVAEEGFDYVKKLWGHIHEHPHQFLTFFQEYEFSEHYAPEARAPWTKFKAIMADDAKSDERRLLEDLLEDSSTPGISNEVLIWKAFKDVLDQRGVGAWLKGKAVGGFLKPLGFVRANDTRYSVEGVRKKLRVWTRVPEMLDDGGRIRGDKLDLAIRVNEEVEDTGDLENLAGNVVSLRRS